MSLCSVDVDNEIIGIPPEWPSIVDMMLTDLKGEVELIYKMANISAKIRCGMYITDLDLNDQMDDFDAFCFKHWPLIFQD